MTTEKLYLDLRRQGSFITVVARHSTGAPVPAPHVVSMAATGGAFLYNKVLFGGGFEAEKPFVLDGYGRIQVAEGR